MPKLLLALLLTTAGCVARKPSPAAGVVPRPAPAEPAEAAPAGPDHVALDLLRVREDGDRVFVRATLPDGQPGLFLVDTGASLSAVSGALAERLRLKRVDGGVTVTGLSGRSEVAMATLPRVDLGGLIVPDVQVAIDVPGLPSHVGALPLDGILGNNVWGRFVVALDYPASLIEIGAPGTIAVPDSARPMVFDGLHAWTELTLTLDAPGHDPLPYAARLEIDTGAGGLLLAGPVDEGLLALTSQGDEPVFGLGLSDAMPVSAFYQQTRRVHVSAVELGGARVELDLSAIWLPEASGQAAGTPGLVGHAVLDGHVLTLDYPGGRVALTPSARPPRALNAHAIYLDEELSAHGEAPERGLERARLRLALEDLDGARADLEAQLAAQADQPEVQALHARVLRAEGEVDAATEALTALSAEALLDQGEAMSQVGSLVLAGRAEEALALARACAEARPEDAQALLALSDALLATGDFEGARRAITDAARASGNPDAFLKRRARVALAEGDAVAAMSHLRQQLGLYPSDGEALWFYALLVAPVERGGLGLTAATPTLRADLDRAMGRLHPEARPLDFLAASHVLLGDDPELVEALQSEGLARDCGAMLRPHDQDNCRAWYLAMGGDADEDTLALIRRALDEAPHSPGYLDTLAMVHLVRGEWALAAEASARAARLGPDRFYLVWQAERLARMASGAATE